VDVLHARELLICEHFDKDRSGRPHGAVNALH